jgi:hypothetical protein
MGESQGAEVSREAGQESQTQNECSSEGKNCGGSQGALEEGEGGWQKDAVIVEILREVVNCPESPARL